MTLDESPPSFEYRVMRHAGPRGRAGEGGNVPKEPGALRQSTSVLLGTSGVGLSGEQRPLPALPDPPLGAGCVGMGARPGLETHFLKRTEGWEGVGTGGMGGLVSLKLNVLISGGRY